MIQKVVAIFIFNLFQLQPLGVPLSLFLCPHHLPVFSPSVHLVWALQAVSGSLILFLPQTKNPSLFQGTSVPSTGEY